MYVLVVGIVMSTTMQILTTCCYGNKYYDSDFIVTVDYANYHTEVRWTLLLGELHQNQIPSVWKG